MGPGGILIFRNVETECPNYRFHTASFGKCGTLLRIFKLECQGGECRGLDCNRGRSESVNKKRRKLLDESEMFLPELDFARPLNFVCKDCLEPSGIMGKCQLGGRR